MSLELLESFIPKPASDTPAAYEELEEHLIKAFSTFESLNESFLNGKESSIQDPGVDLDAVRAFYQRLRELPRAPSLFLSLIKTSEVLLRRPGRPLKRKEDLRFLLIILENPALGINFFNSLPGLHPPSPTKVPPSPTKPASTTPKRVSLDERRSSKVIDPQSLITDKSTNSPSPTKGPAHPRQASAPVPSMSTDAQHTQHSLMKRLYGIISNLPNELHHYLVNWFARLSPAIFRRRVEMINSFIAYRLGKHQKRALLSGPSGASKVQRQLYTNDWQIKASARMMALFFAANTNRPKIQLSEFYNTLVDYCDLITDFDTWELKFGKFSFCQYPFLLSMGAKMNIMEYDARRQMEIKAREAFFTTVFQKRVVAPHLILKVRRDCIIEDSLTQISCNEMDVKKGLRIEFVGEDGVDAGGLRKEWFLLLCREVFDPLYGMPLLLANLLTAGMFTWDEDSKYCWFNPNSFETSDQFFLVGVVLGLAIYNSTILDIHLPLACYKKLLGAHCGLEDLKTFRPTVANSLEKLLAYDGDDFEDVFGLDFVTQKVGYGQTETVDLVPGGSRKPVTKANRHEYVRRYTEYLLDSSVSKQFEPFKRGFYHVCGGNALSLFRPEEIELLIRGSPEKLDVDQLRAVAVYEGENSRVPVSENEPVIRWYATCPTLSNLQVLEFLCTNGSCDAAKVTDFCHWIRSYSSNRRRQSRVQDFHSGGFRKQVPDCAYMFQSTLFVPISESGATGEDVD
jgi:E3 ubiquitin-protein ligase HECTD2